MASLIAKKNLVKLAEQIYKQTHCKFYILYDQDGNYLCFIFLHKTSKFEFLKGLVYLNAIPSHLLQVYLHILFCTIYFEQ